MRVLGRARHRLIPLLVLAWALVPATAHAWVERTVKSDNVTLDVERDGTAVVTHEILLSVWGGLLADIFVDADPSTADAELLDGANRDPRAERTCRRVSDTARHHAE